jgi:hypothetical protein
LRTAGEINIHYINRSQGLGRESQRPQKKDGGPVFPNSFHLFTSLGNLSIQYSNKQAIIQRISVGKGMEVFL